MGDGQDFRTSKGQWCGLAAHHGGGGVKQLLIYEQPLVLNRQQHRHLRIKPVLDSFGFAGALNSVPLTTTEFAQAARDFPIVFAGEGAEPDETKAHSAGMPAALLGLSRDDNLFVEADGRWAADAYVPAFLRRYPFVVANQDASPESFTVCVDTPFLASDDDGLKLFEDSGEDAPALKRALGFLADYQAAVLRTQSFMQQLRESKLLVPKTIKVERPGSQAQTLSGFHVVDETRLQKLSGKDLAKLSKTGALGLIYAHVMSLSNVQRLSARLDARSSVPRH